MPEKHHASIKFYVRSIVIVLAVGVGAGAMGFVVQGFFFGFDHVTIFSILPAFFYGVFGTTVVLYLLTRNRINLHPLMDQMTSEIPEKRHHDFKLYTRLLITILVCGVVVGAGAVIVQGRFFGFDNVTIITILPAFFYGILAAAAISYIVLRNQENLLKRLIVETAISTKLRTEIEERARVDLALKESEQRYRSILDNMQDTYYRINLDGVIVMASPAAATLFGYEDSELIGRKLNGLYVDPTRHEAFLRQLEANGEVVG